MLATIFGLSLLIFHHTVLVRHSKREPFKLPKQKRAEAAAKMNQQQKQHPTAENAVPKVETVVPQMEQKGEETEETETAKEKEPESEKADREL